LYREDSHFRLWSVGKSIIARFLEASNYFVSLYSADKNFFSPNDLPSLTSKKKIKKKHKKTKAKHLSSKSLNIT
jgi:hypothetical protein